MTTPELDLQPLEDKYEILGELGARAEGRAFVGRRRDDGANMLIVVARTPAGDERNALTHFAADANLLATLTHTNFIPVVEGRWIGSDAFAVVSERVVAPSLEELLARGVELSGARIAAILQDVNGVLKWARGHKVVHRAVTASSVFLEPVSDEVLVSFEIRPIRLAGTPDVEADARTIAALAAAMFTRRPELAEQLPEPLAELRPDLPKRVVEQTEALLHSARGSEALPDVRSYIATIAMADAVKAGEEEGARIQAATIEEQRVARAQLEAERQEHDLRMATERQRLADEHAELQSALAKDRDVLVEERQQLAAELAALEQRRAEVDRHLAESEQRMREADRRRAEIEQSVELDRGVGEALMVGAPLGGNPSTESSPADAALVESAPPPAAVHPRSRRAGWVLPAAAVGVAGIVVSSAFGIANRSRSRSSAPTTTGVLVDSAAGALGPRASRLPTHPSPSPAVTPQPTRAGAPDSVSGATTAAPAPPLVTKPRRRRRRAPIDSLSARVDSARPTATRDTVAPRDSLVGRDTVARRLRTKPKRDTTARPDTLRKPDTLGLKPALR